MFDRVTLASAQLAARHYKALNTAPEVETIQHNYGIFKGTPGYADRLAKFNDDLSRSIGLAKLLVVSSPGVRCKLHAKVYGETAGINPALSVGAVGYSLFPHGANNSSTEIILDDSLGSIYLSWEKSSQSTQPLIAETNQAIDEHLGDLMPGYDNAGWKTASREDQNDALNLIRRASAFLDVIRFEILPKYVKLED